jgi:renalase
MDPVIVVGAGISGIACARTLADAGLPVLVLDRGRRVGGRMAVRTHEGRPVDVGASYFTVSDDRFADRVAQWEARGLAAPWTETFHAHAPDGTVTAAAGPMRWGSPGGLRSLVEDLAQGLDVREQTVQRVGPGPEVDGLSASAVVLAMPDPQAARLLDPTFSGELSTLDQVFDPVLALTAGWVDRTWTSFGGMFVNSDPVLSWIADDGDRRGDDAPVLVAHSTPDLAQAHLESPADALVTMLDSMRSVLLIAEEPEWTHMQRWTFGKPAGTRSADHFLSESLIGLCGDSWSDRPRVEAAYLSGAALARALIDRLQ